MRSTSLKRLLLVFSFSIFIFACTLPFYIGASEPEEKIVYIEVTSTPQQAEELTDDEDQDDEEIVPEATPTVSINIDGAWTIWYGVDEDELSINFLQKGYEIVANAATSGDDSMSISGSINQAGDQVEGIWETTDGSSGTFTMVLSDDLFSFTGNMGGGVAFCGVRGSTAKPLICIK